MENGEWTETQTRQRVNKEKLNLTRFKPMIACDSIN